jgi:hypothetical protein
MSIEAPVPDDEEETMLRPIRLSEPDMGQVLDSVFAEPQAVPAMAEALRKNRTWQAAIAHEER